MKIKINIYLIVFTLSAVCLFNPALYGQEGTTAADDEASGAPSAENKYAENLRRWQSLSEDQRQAIREKAKGLTPEQKDALKDGYAKFKGMPQEEQARVKANYEKFKQLEPVKREILKEKFQRFQKLAPEEKKELQRKFKEKKEAPLVDEVIPQAKPEKILEQKYGQDKEGKPLSKPPKPEVAPGETWKKPLPPKAGSGAIPKKPLPPKDKTEATWKKPLPPKKAGAVSTWKKPLAPKPPKAGVKKR